MCNITLNMCRTCEKLEVEIHADEEDDSREMTPQIDAIKKATA